jgi:subtilisin family serine protease
MDTYIAIKKSAHLSSAGLSDSSDTAQKRIYLREESLSQSLQKKALLQQGLNEIPAHESLAEKYPEKTNDSFTRFDHVDAYILRLSNQDKVKQSRDIFGDDYYVVPNNNLLTLPESQGSGNLGESSRSSNWPAESNIEKAHQEGLKGEDVIVAVLDTGCDADHVQFSDKVVDFRYFSPTSTQLPRAIRGFDLQGHGTHVCGIIAGKKVGIAPQATLMVASVIESEKTSTSLMRIVAALEWLTTKVIEPGNEQKAVILNLSLGFKPKDVSSGSEKVVLAAMRDLLKTLAEGYDVLPVVAIGNEGQGNFRYPAGFPEVLAVGAVDNQLTPWNLSGGGLVNIDGQSLTKPDVVGYGVDVYSSFERTIEGHSRYQKKSGTSMATPYVSGVAALIAQETGLRGSALRDRLMSLTLPLPKYPQERVGSGVVRFSL